MRMELDKGDKLFLGGSLIILVILLLYVAIVVPERLGYILAMASISFVVAFLVGYIVS